MIRASTGVWMLLIGVLIGLFVSKFSHRIGYEAGLSTGMAHQQTAQVCTDWWFNGSAQRISDAKKFICRGKQ